MRNSAGSAKWKKVLYAQIPFNQEGPRVIYVVRCRYSTLPNAALVPSTPCTSSPNPPTCGASNAPRPCGCTSTGRSCGRRSVRRTQAIFDSGHRGGACWRSSAFPAGWTARPNTTTTMARPWRPRKQAMARWCAGDLRGGLPARWGAGRAGHPGARWRWLDRRSR